MTAYPKPRPRLLDKADRTAKRVEIDEAESKKVKVRSGGRCEVVVVGKGRCQKHAHSVHHMIDGIGVRGRGPSALAKHKQHVCDGPKGHHRLITGNVLKLVPSGALPLWTDAYEMTA